MISSRPAISRDLSVKRNMKDYLHVLLIFHERTLQKSETIKWNVDYGGFVSILILKLMLFNYTSTPFVHDYDPASFPPLG